MPQRVQRYGLWVALLFLAGVKLWLVHRHEIAVCDYPFDDPWYIVASIHAYWRGSFAESGFVRPPGYPLWIAVSRLVGVPQRIAIELLLLASGAAMARAMLAIGLSRVAAALVFALIVFHPLSIFVNDSVLSDALYGPVFLLAVAAMLGLLAHPTRRVLLVAAGALLAWLWHTRHESQLVIGYVLVFAAVCAWTRWRNDAGWGAIARELAVIGLSLGLIIGATTMVVRTANQIVFGAFADHALAMADYQSLNAALLRIRPATDACTVPISRAALRHAFDASPTFRTVQPYFDGPDGQNWADISVQYDASEKEIAGGAMPWALLGALRWAGQGNTAAATNAFCRQAAAEINTACDSGVLTCTSSLGGPLVRLRNCASRLPWSVGAMASVFWWTSPEFTPHCPPTDNSPATVDLFNVALNRRHALVTETTHIAGWAIDPNDPVRSVSFRDATGRTLAMTDQLRARPDLDAAFADQVPVGSEATRGAFALTIAIPRDIPQRGALMFERRSGRSASVEYDELRTIPLRERRKTIADPSLEYAIEQRNFVEPRDLGASRAQSLLLRTYGHLVIALGIGAMLAMIVLLAVRRRAAAGTEVLPGALLLLGLCAVRFTVFTIVVTLMWPAADPRYLYPIVSLLPCASLMLISCALRRERYPNGSTAALAPTAKR